jgi:hypothetical protein
MIPISIFWDYGDYLSPTPLRHGEGLRKNKFLRLHRLLGEGGWEGEVHFRLAKLLVNMAIAVSKLNAKVARPL